MPTAKASTRPSNSTSLAIRSGPGWRSGKRAVWRILSACSEPESSEGDPTGGPGLVSADPERQGAGRPGPDVQPVYPRLDQLLRPFLQVGTVSDLDADRCLSRQVGEAQVQTPAG